MMLSAELKPHLSTPPAKRWRNFYRVYRVLRLWPMGYVFPGLIPGPSVFPSKEIADERAAAFVNAVNWPNRCMLEHAGAFPEGEQAN